MTRSPSRAAAPAAFTTPIGPSSSSSRSRLLPLLSSFAPHCPHPRGTLCPVAPLPYDGEDSGDVGDAASFGGYPKRRSGRQAAKFSEPSRAAALDRKCCTL